MRYRVVGVHRHSISAVRGCGWRWCGWRRASEPGGKYCSLWRPIVVVKRGGGWAGGWRIQAWSWSWSSPNTFSPLYVMYCRGGGAKDAMYKNGDQG